MTIDSTVTRIPIPRLVPTDKCPAANKSFESLMRAQGPLPYVVALVQETNRKPYYCDASALMQKFESDKGIISPKTRRLCNRVFYFAKEHFSREFCYLGSSAKTQTLPMVRNITRSCARSLPAAEILLARKKILLAFVERPTETMADIYFWIRYTAKEFPNDSYFQRLSSLMPKTPDPTIEEISALLQQIRTTTTLESCIDTVTIKATTDSIPQTRQQLAHNCTDLFFLATSNWFSSNPALVATYGMALTARYLGEALSLPATVRGVASYALNFFNLMGNITTVGTTLQSCALHALTEIPGTLILGALAGIHLLKNISLIRK